EAVKHARGQTFDEVQKGEDKAVKARALLSGGTDQKTGFVVFVGGITFTEIAALRFIAKKEEGAPPPLSTSLQRTGQANVHFGLARRNIVMCTTSIISGNEMMAAAIERGSFARENTQASTHTPGS